MANEAKIKTTKEDIYRYLLDKAKTVESFTKDQVPSVIREYLNWIILSNILTFMFNTSVILGTVLFCRYFSINYNEIHNATDDMNMFFHTTGLILVLSSAVSILYCYKSAQNVLKALVAPKVIILEKLSSLLDEVKK